MIHEKLKKIIWLQNIKKYVQREVKTDKILIISINEFSGVSKFSLMSLNSNESTA